MSRLDELIRQYCPHGVSLSRVEDLIKAKKISTITPSLKVKRNDYKEEGSTPIVSQEVDYVSGYCDLVDKNIPNGEYVCFGDHTEYIKYINFAFVQGADGLKIMKMMTDSISAKYIFYAISNYYKPLNNYERHFKYLLDLVVPIPPLPVQEEIVRILDTFTELEMELETELEVRKKQYEYYREKLLTFDEDVPKVPCADLIEFVNGRAYKQEELLDEGKYRVVRVGNFYSNGSWYYSNLELEEEKYCQKGDLLFTWAATLGPQFWNEEKAIFHYHIWKLKFDESILDKHYLYHFLQFDLKSIFNSLTNSTMPHISMASMNKRIISLPPIERQREIAEKLDVFDTLCNDLTQGLPKELELQRKQYEYYRDRILSFQRKEV